MHLVSRTKNALENALELRPRATGPGPKNENVNFSHFWIPGVKKVKNDFAAKYAIWKHLDSSTLQIIAKAAS